MTLAFWCVLIAGLMPYAAVTIAKWDKSYLGNNHQPRDWEAKLTGTSSRAHAAHLNSFEAFPLFAAGVIIAVMCKAPQPLVDGVAVAFLLTRVVYIWCYVSNRARMRSLVWMASLAMSVALFFLAAFAGSH